MKHLINILFFVTWFIPFFDTGLFIYPSLSHSLFWGVLSCFLLLLISSYLIKKRNLYYTKYLWIVLFYLFYLVVHSICVKAEHYRLYYYMSGFVFLIITYYSCLNRFISFFTLKRLLFAGLFIQLVFVYGQGLGLWKSDSPYFPVTGCYENPNIAAMYISLTFPFIANELYNKRRCIIYSLLLLCSLIALYLLNCRTAWLATIVPLGVFVVKPLFYIITSKVIQKVMLFSCMIFTLLLIVFLYQYKQDSANGRILVWELSAKEIIHHPQGHGYGRLASVYNQIQSEYFRNEQSSVTERQNARFTAMAYNDYLENGVDGGIGGLLLHVLLIGTFVFLSYKQRNRVTFSVFLMIAVMGLVNFVVIGILPWMIFLLMAGYTLCVQPQTTIKPFFIHKMVCLSVIVFAAFLCYKQIRYVQGQYLLKTLQATKSESLQSLSDFIGTSEAYHRAMSQFYFRKKDWQNAIGQCDEALQYTMQPSIIQMKAHALLQENRIDDAESTLQMLRYMIPTHLRSRFQLFQLYRQNNLLQEAHEMAHEILMINPKIVSKETLYIQQTVRNYLNHIHNEHDKYSCKKHH